MKGHSRRHSAVVTVVALGALLLAAPLAAQDRGDRRPGPRDRQEMEERARAMMERLIRERLGLTPEESSVLRERMDGFHERRRELFREERATRRRVEAMLLEGGDDTVEARALLDRMVELREQESSLFREEQAALLEVITPVQVLQLHEVREEIARRMRAIRGRRGGDGPVHRRPGAPAMGFHGIPGER